MLLALGVQVRLQLALNARITSLDWIHFVYLHAHNASMLIKHHKLVNLAILDAKYVHLLASVQNVLTIPYQI